MQSLRFSAKILPFSYNIFGGGFASFILKRNKHRGGMSVGYGHAHALRRNAGRRRRHDFSVRNICPDFQRLDFALFFFARNIGDNVVVNLRHRIKRFSRARNGLISAHRRRPQPVFPQRLQKRRKRLHRTIRFRCDKSALCSEAPFLKRDDVQLHRVDFGNNHRHVRGKTIRGII